MMQRKQKAVNPKANGVCSELIITIEKLPTHKLTAYKPQGDYAPYKNCQTSSNLAHLGSISEGKNTQISINRLRKLLKDWNIDNPHTFALIISNSIGAEPSKERVVSAEDAEEISYYLNLPEYSLRIGLHNLNADNYKGTRNRPMNYGVTLKDFTKKDTFRGKQGVKVKEYVYLYFTKERLKLIAKAILHLLENGEWDDSIAKADYENPTALEGANTDDVFDERETMRFALHQLVKELGEKEGKATFEWYCKTYNVTISDPMPEAVKYEIFGTDKPFLELDDLNAKLSALRKFFRDRDKDKRYNYKVRICSAENDGKDPIHAYKYPTGTAYADIRFEIHSEGSSGWDYLRIAFKFDNTNEVRIDCDALPEYKELIAQLQQSDNNSTYAFAKEIAALYEQGERLDWVKAKKLAAPHRIESEQAIMQACELAVVLSARKIAQNGQSIAQRYAALKDLYEQQVTIRPLDTQSKLLQQYSTPCPLAFLLGEYVKGATDLKEHQQYYLEPSAGNGMLTIALPTDKVFANDLDEIRYQNLLVQGFHKVENGDALRMIPNPNFRGIITNPPFAKLAPKDKIERHGWEINALDYKMAVLALDNMANHGRAAIIVGGKMWNSYWKQQSETSKKRVLFGQWKTFLGYLYATYNVEDVIYINGDNIYRKQGTTYPIVVILINRRWNEYSEEHKPNYVFDPERDTIIDTFDQLFERMMKYLQSAPSSLDDINVEEIRRKLEDGTAASMVDQIYQKANAAAEEEEKRERDIAARKRKFAFKLKLQLQLKEQDKAEQQPKFKVGDRFIMKPLKNNYDEELFPSEGLIYQIIDVDPEHPYILYTLEPKNAEKMPKTYQLPKKMGEATILNLLYSEPNQKQSACVWKQIKSEESQPTEVSRMIDEYFEKHPIDIDKTAEKRGYLRDNIAYCQEKIEKEREKGKRASQSKIDAYEERIAECQQMLQTHAMQKPQVQVGAWYVNNKHHDMVTYIYDNWGGKYQRRIYMNGQYKSSNEFTDSEIFLQNHTKIDTPKWASQEIQSKERDLQRGDVFTLPKTWLKKSFLFAEEKDLLDFYSIAQVTNDGSVVVINEQTMLPQTYSIKEFEEKGFKFHHHQDNYGQIKK